MVLNGIGVSKGIAIAKAFIYEKKEIQFEVTSKVGADEEKKRFKAAIEKFIEDTTKIAETMKTTVGEYESEIMEAHILLAQDPELSTGVKDALDTGVTAEAAVSDVLTMFEEMFAAMDDDLMKQRASDFADIRTRLLEILTGVEGVGIDKLPYDCVLITKDLVPSDTGQMDKSKVKGIVTEIGGMTSHTAIIARAMEIPAILGVDGAVGAIANESVMIIDGETGNILVNPSERDIADAQERRREQEEARKALDIYLEKEAVAKDGVRVELCANIGGLQDLDSVLRNGADGVGLFRTEFLFMDRKDAPSEDEQYDVYKSAAEALKGKPVIIRTLDIGGDKEVPFLDMPKEENPFLGYRAIRLCLGRNDLFKPQIRALLRAGVHGCIKIMIPMISTVDELRAAEDIIAEVKEELEKENIPYDKNIQVGIMIETPAAVVMSDALAKESDFFSIGTNDLTQYTMAVDRGNKQVSYLYKTYDPAVVRSIARVIENGKKAGIMVGMCGEAAGDPLMIPFLLAAGLDEFSMTASSILPAKKLISELESGVLKTKLPMLLELGTADEVKKYLSDL